MADQINTPNTISMALDMKRNRIRIHKPAIHMLGNPTLIQLLFDPEDTWTVRPEAFASKGRNTPFAGWELKGRVRCTVVGGETVYDAEAAR